MGFLDHSTNNVIIDAVLTDEGRAKLARNNGTFKIVHYGFGDDEVDYTIIKKFGRTIGKEKIEKNTPVFEGQTIGALALKHPLVTLSNPTLTVFPSLAVAAGSSQTLQNIEGQNTSVVTINQSIPSNTSQGVSALLRETQYRVTLDSRFITLAGTRSAPRTVPFSPNLVYDMSASSAGVGESLSTLRLTFRVVSTGSSLTAFQDSNNKVTTVVKVDGLITGVSTTFEIQVQY
ncbi:MAG TPA: hypothetical protein DD671_07320 [Balneolaceae bacterium]|nr:hypothetical protein [Balneolaceae bacterium]